MTTALLMTATVVPQPAFVGRITTPLEPAIRQNEYFRAVSHYLSKPGFEDVIFCENSGADLSFVEPLKMLAVKMNKRLELLSFSGNPETIARFGYYGCGDAEIIDYAFEHSKLLRDHGSFHKVTGRYVLQEPRRVIDAIGERHDFFCHDGYRPIVTFGTVMLEVMTAFFKVSRQTYERHLFNKVMPTYDALYNSPKVSSLFPRGYPCVLLEQVYYVLLRNFLKTQKTYRYVPIFFEHWQFPPWFCWFRNFSLSLLQIDQFQLAHWIADGFFFDRLYGEILPQ